MTPAERSIAIALGRCSFPPGSWDKRFARDLASVAERSPEIAYTERQAAHLLRLAHKYRRQLPSTIIESALDEMENAANRRVENGQGALPDFTPARQIRRKERAKRGSAQLPAMPLFEAGS